MRQWYPLLLLEPTRWADLRLPGSRRSCRSWQKGDQAIPISLLNLHASTATPETAVTERALTTLLFHRLALEPGIFVLERRNWAARCSRKAWQWMIGRFRSGGYLLEGVIEAEDPVRGAPKLAPGWRHAKPGRPGAGGGIGFHARPPSVGGDVGAKNSCGLATELDGNGLGQGERGGAI